MDVTLRFVDALPDAAAFEQLMREYFTEVLGVFADAGGERLSPRAVAADTMAHMGDYLPPDGALLLAEGADGALLGCGVIRKIRPEACELKRMFIRPEARGLGLGRKLVEMRMEQARAMGCAEVFVDTVRGNRSMLKIYESLGFSYIDRYPENANPPHYAPYLVYLTYRFADAG